MRASNKGTNVPTTRLHIGCAGWAIPRIMQREFPAGGTHLQRYADRLSASEINSSFYRAHKPATYARWSESVPADFRFSVKIPRVISHELRLENAFTALDEFLFEATHLEDKLGCLLLQLPPSFSFNSAIAQTFFAGLRERFEGAVALEARHSTWFTPDAILSVSPYRISYVQADPELFGSAAAATGATGVAYFRLHGSPRVYYSKYTNAELEEFARRVRAVKSVADVWCIFDNTASGAAAPNALELSDLLRAGAHPGDTTTNGV